MKNTNKTHSFKISTRFAEGFLGVIIVVCLFLIMGCVGGLEQDTLSGKMFLIIATPSCIAAILAAKALEFVYDIEIELKRQARLERQRIQEREMQRLARRGHINFNYDLTQMNKEARPNADKVVLVPLIKKAS